MNMPGFTATSTLIHPYRQRVIPALRQRQDQGDEVNPRADCLMDCLESCIDSPDTTQCLSGCREKCRDRTPWYQCTERDNSYNYYVDQAGIWAWEQACKLDCSLFLPGALCDRICGSLANEMRKTAQPKTVCV